MMVAGHTHIVQRHLLLPLIICHSNQIEVKYSHLPESAPKDKLEVKTDLHVEPPHHMQKLDETHCKALSFLQSENAVQESKGRRRTSIGQHDLWIMEVGHDRGRNSRYEARGGREDRGGGGENDEEGDIESANIEGYINACAN
jgi:hypothetical protein